MHPPLIVLVGPTATGKSALAVSLARELMGRGKPAEVVNADSMLVYRGMDIGTAKPSEAERGGVPHHLIDILEVTETASVADFQACATGVIAELRVLLFTLEPSPMPSSSRVQTRFSGQDWKPNWNVLGWKNCTLA